MSVSFRPIAGISSYVVEFVAGERHNHQFDLNR